MLQWRRPDPLISEAGGMKEAQADAKLIAWVGFPDPPHRIRESRPWMLVIVGHVAMGILFLAGVGILVAYFGFGQVGRGLLVDSVLAAGLGTPLPDAQVTVGPCDYDATRAGSRLPGHWSCPTTVVAAGERIELSIEMISDAEDLRARGAGRVFGQTGVYWPLGMLAARWWNVSPLILIGGGLIGIAAMAFRWSFRVRSLSRARHGSVRTVDLLTWKGRPWFAYLDDRGTRRFQRTASDTVPLILDGVRTTGAALISGRTAVLLDANLRPMELDDSRRGEILARVGQVQRQCQIRSLLPPEPGDPATLAGRIECIEQALAGKPGAPDLRRLYGEAWRLIWDSNDADVANRALDARDVIAQRLGPSMTSATLRDCRRRYEGAGGMAKAG
jgi:hypothetical protein